ncbi:MAG: DNA repair protein RadC [Ignavibacteriaceae bacterium]
MGTVKDLPLDDRPREKLILRGSQSLSDGELLAILLRTGTKGKSVLQLALELVNRYGNLASLSTKSYAELIKTSGIKKDKAATLVAAFEIGKRTAVQSKWFSEKKITSPEDVVNIFLPLLKDELNEHFYVVCLNSANKIIRIEKISTGSLDSSIVHPREVFKVAIENSAKSIILVHNHPSGNAEPSSEDIAITKKLVEVSKLMEIPIFDHLIIAERSYTSFVQKRLI